MSRYLEIYGIMLRNSLIRDMSFKANFLLWIVVEMLWFSSQIIFVEVLFGYIGSIGDWTKWQMVLLIATHQLTGQIFQAFFYINLSNITELVRTGKMDFMLMLPIDSQFAVSTRQFGLDNLINAVVSVAIVTLSLAKLGIQPTLLQVLLYSVAVVFGVAVHYAIMFSLATLSFWIVRAQGIIYGYFNIMNLGRYPDIIYKGAFRLVFTLVVPVILVANVPARVLMGMFSGPSLLFLAPFLLGTVAIFFASRVFWKIAEHRYRSASS